MPSKKRSGTRASRPKPKAVFFLDRCTNSKVLATTLTLVGVAFERHSDHFDDDVDDAEWLRVVGEKGWVVLTNDKRIRYRQIERDALLASGVKAFVLTVGNLTSEAAAELWKSQLIKIERIASSTRLPFIAHVTRSAVKIMLKGHR